MKKALFLVATLALVVLSCKKPGCTDPGAENYDENAKKDDSSCVYAPEDHRLPVLGYYLMNDSVFVNGEFSDERLYSIRLRLESGDAELSDKIVIEGLFGSEHVYFANVDKYYDLEFPAQATAPGSGINFTGDGYIYGHFLSYNTYYSYDDGGIIDVRSKVLGDK